MKKKTPKRSVKRNAVRQFTDQYDRKLEDFLEMMLEDYSFEEFIEMFDMTANEVFLNMFYSGLIDERDLKNVGFQG